MKIKKGDHVVVVAGKDKGAAAWSSRPTRTGARSLVQGVNMVKKNKKVTNQGVRGAKEGGITHPGGADRREQRAAGRPGEQAAGAGRLPDQRGRHQGPRRRPSGKEI